MLASLALLVYTLALNPVQATACEGSFEGCDLDDGEISLRQLRAVRQQELEGAEAEKNNNDALAQEGDEDLTKTSSDWGPSPPPPSPPSYWGPSPPPSNWGPSPPPSNWGAPRSTEKCCQCTSGSVGWSASGRCSFCHGQVSKTANPPYECQKSSPKFMGSHACAKTCKSQVKQDSFSWLEEAATEENEDEALAQEGDEDLTKTSSDWGPSPPPPSPPSYWGPSPPPSNWGPSPPPSNWGAPRSTEKCCQCTSGSVGWSASGRCSFCHGQVSKTANPPYECQKSSPKFMGSHACAKTCKSQVKQNSFSWLEEAATEENEDEALAQEGDEDLTKTSSDWGPSPPPPSPPSYWGPSPPPSNWGPSPPPNNWGAPRSTEKCCQCTSGSVGWSASGRCSFCHGQVSKTANPPYECQKSSPKFMGSHACAKTCKSQVKQDSFSWLEEAATEENEDEALAQEGDEDLTKTSSDWGPSPPPPSPPSYWGPSPPPSNWGPSPPPSNWGAPRSTEKCCQCTSGSVGWSASGRCSFCHGQVSKTANPPYECQKSSPKFMGSHACAKTCKSQVKQNSFSWLEEAATEENEDEALAQEGDEDLTKTSSDWGPSPPPPSPPSYWGPSPPPSNWGPSPPPNNWGAPRSTEKCCQCTSGSVGWSASGRCSFCHGQVSKTANPPYECQKSSPKFMGSHACAKTCKSQVKQDSFSWLEEAATEENEDEALAQEGDEDLTKTSSDWGPSPPPPSPPSYWGPSPPPSNWGPSPPPNNWGAPRSTEKCCQCTSGSVGWSASGRCSFCHGQVSKTANPPYECQKSSPKFMGSHACAKTCKSQVKQDSFSWLEEDHDEAEA
ncbi:HSF [Symbiodinium natans]|uniref:HSF protein n=1 Tax=Symbiodinium natans TaxID=878477 RepID=A0A812JM29_9DINO|nr:HSF [Symbiodinium natans]